MLNLYKQPYQFLPKLRALKLAGLQAATHLSTCLIACLQLVQAVNLAWLHANQLQLPNNHTLYAGLHDSIVQPNVEQEQLFVQEVPVANADLCRLHHM